MNPRKKPDAPPELPFVAPADRAEWRAWLAEHHGSERGAFLAVGKRGNTVTSLSYEQAIEEALCFGWIDGTTTRLDGDRYRLRMSPRRRGSGWASSNKKRVARLEREGLLAPAGIAAIEAAKADGSWTLLDDVEALALPADLAEALAANPEAERQFASMPDSARKMALHWIITAKRAETRAARIAAAVSAAAEGRLPV